ncbi:MAG: hypothetical protein A2Z83_04725 [Omnitrophica bacterium GWA2_52_8]|nr:MAG: hypothetical protein A2Z83_04725 [Omnitrophica bacterium GWA2_52_8]
MSHKEHFIQGIGEQLKVLENLMSEMGKKERIAGKDFEKYAAVTREVEKNLSRLRKLASHELVKEIKT